MILALRAKMLKAFPILPIHRQPLVRLREDCTTQLMHDDECLCYH